MHDLKEKLVNFNIFVLGPAPAPIFKKNKQFRMQLLLKSLSRKELHSALHFLKQSLSPKVIPSGVSFNIDVDPLEVT